MIYDELHGVRSFFRRLRNAGSGTPGRNSALLILSAALLSGMASGQVPTTTALPYLLTDQAGVIRVVPNYAVAPVPPAASLGGFGSLLGGGFSSLLTNPTAAAASAAATAAVRKLSIMKKAYDLKVDEARRLQDAQQAEQNLEDKVKDFNSDCDEPFSVKFNHHLKRRARTFNHQPKTGVHAADSPACSLPEEQQAEEAEEELEALNESGEATQEAIEAAETAAEAADTAAEAAEVAAEAALDGLDVLEALLDALSLF